MTQRVENKAWTVPIPGAVSDTCNVPFGYVVRPFISPSSVFFTVSERARLMSPVTNKIPFPCIPVIYVYTAS